MAIGILPLIRSIDRCVDCAPPTRPCQDAPVLDAAPPVQETTTRERILAAAARLASERGYHGASTRAIAAAAGIRQSTLFHHFATKDAIFDALLSAALEIPDQHARQVAALGGAAAPRLYRYLIWDAASILTAPISLAGLFMDQLRGTPEHDRWAPTLASWLGALETLVRAGQQSGEFLAVPVAVAVEMLHAASIAAIRLRDREPDADAATCADAIGRMCLRMLLADPTRLDAIIEDAAALAITEPRLLAWSGQEPRLLRTPRAGREAATTGVVLASDAP
jgi:AcrR family transcriptional regulator